MAGESQFGLDVAQAARIAGECIANPYAEFMGLHFYFGSQRLSPQPIVRMVELASEVLETFRSKGLRVRVVDLGLGCGVPYLERDAALDVRRSRSSIASHLGHAIVGVNRTVDRGRPLAGCGGRVLCDAGN